MIKIQIRNINVEMDDWNLSRRYEFNGIVLQNDDSMNLNDLYSRSVFCLLTEEEYNNLLKQSNNKDHIFKDSKDFKETNDGLDFIEI